MVDTLETDSVILSYGSRYILRDVYLRLSRGKVTGLFGLNGSGKSTLLKVITGDARPEQGQVMLNGVSIFGKTCSAVSYLPQYHFVPGGLTPERVFQHYGVDTSVFLDDFPEFSRLMAQTIRKLSGGEQRIIEINAVLRQDKRFILLDEPFSNVMPKYIGKLKEIIRSESACKGILVTDHMYRDVLSICDDIYVVSDCTCRRLKDSSELIHYGYLSGI